jgi:DNA-directed RNA polymerase II subunit RPB2
VRILHIQNNTNFFFFVQPGTLSHLRRVNSPIGREGKAAKPRMLHNTHWGMVSKNKKSNSLSSHVCFFVCQVCPSETPEGQACGLVKNLALMSYISVGSDSGTVKNNRHFNFDVFLVFVLRHVFVVVQVVEPLQDYGTEALEEIRPSDVKDAYKIFVNGAWMGVHRDVGELERVLRTLRRKVTNKQTETK